MDGNDQRNDRHEAALSCPDCRLGLQDYLDGTLEKKQSVAVFLHLRECASCRHEHEALRAVFACLDTLPAVEAPADFDAAILASVPYAAYQAMEPLRRERVPVFLEDHFLPAWLRSRVPRRRRFRRPRPSCPTRPEGAAPMRHTPHPWRNAMVFSVVNA